MGCRKRAVYVPPEPCHGELITGLSDALSLSAPTICILLKRGFDDEASIRSFLSPALDDLHDPFQFNDMERAVKRIIKAIDKREKILVYGDYDVDGISSVALLMRNLLLLEGDAVYFVPHRLREGYGFSGRHLQEFKERGVSLIITVDCGINAQKAILKAKDLGIDVIVTDHHPPQKELEEAYAVIDPKTADERYPFKELAGVGVAFKLIDAVFKRCGREQEIFKDLDLVALGTVADVVPLVGENRILAKIGMEVLSDTEKMGLQALKEKCGRYRFHFRSPAECKRAA
jgi:single-stranded-DNA-specific exonuclease